MKDKKIIYMDGFDEVIDLVTRKVIFKTNIEDSELSESICDNIVIMWNNSINKSLLFGSDGILDFYLLHVDCTQEARELVIESLYEYYED